MEKLRSPFSVSTIQYQVSPECFGFTVSLCHILSGLMQQTYKVDPEPIVVNGVKGPLINCQKKMGNWVTAIISPL